MSWGACSPRTKTPTQKKATMGLKKPTCWHLFTLPSSQTHTHTVHMRIRSGEVNSPLPHIYPVWQHFIAEVDSTRKPGHTFVRFSPLNAIEMGTEYFLALLWHHDIKQLLWVSGSLLCGNFGHMCEQTSLTCSRLWRNNGSVRTMSLAYSFH